MSYQQWEYIEAHVLNGQVAYIEDVPYTEPEKHWREYRKDMGLLGWELVSIFPARGDASNFFAYFKRPLHPD